MEVRELQRIVDDWIQENTPGYWEPNNILLRVMEEVGELSREVNIRFGEKPPKPGYEGEDIGCEIADVIYTLACLANSLNIDLEESFQEILKKYTKRDKLRHD